MTPKPTALQYQSTFSIQDKRFSVTQLQNYHLAISLGERTLRICGIDQLSHRCMFIEAYSFNPVTSSESLLPIEQLWQNHTFLASKLWNTVGLCMENQQYTLIPRSLFQAPYIDTYLKLVTNQHNVAKHVVHPELGVVIAFKIDPVLLKWFQDTYEKNNAYIIHQASSLVAGGHAYLSTKKLGSITKIFVMIESSHIHIIVIKKLHLVYYNRFAYHDSDEILQYILIVMHTLGLAPSSQEIMVSGDITKNSLVYRKLKNYIRQVTFNDYLPHLKLGWSFKSATVSTYFDLLNIYTCQNLS